MFDKFQHGARVRHQEWTDDSGAPLTGTVRVFPEAAPDEVQAEVRWDDSIVANQLELVEDRLELIG
jgi:hypothetical protein